LRRPSGLGWITSLNGPLPNVVAPGAIATDFSGGMVRDNPDLNKRVADMTALGRAGLPDDVAPMIASLLSEDNRWANARLCARRDPQGREGGPERLKLFGRYQR
jgi:NAD(P)-dependent dehydrogenase (short-subunit alcohol dehydrogenase family)